MFAGQCLTVIQDFCFFLTCLMGELLCSSVLVLKACKRCPLPLLGEPPRLGHYREYPHAGKQLWGTTSVNSPAKNFTRELSRRPWSMSRTAQFLKSVWCDSFCVLPSWLWRFHGGEESSKSCNQFSLLVKTLWKKFRNSLTIISLEGFQKHFC